MTRSSSFWTTAAVAVLLALAGCKKNNASSSGSEVTSLLFDTSSPAVREALATPVDFRITEENYGQWEQAQRFLDALPRSAFASADGTSGNPIDRAVATLEASPRARTAIERTGLSVRDFVLETVALAQAAEAAAGKPAGDVTVPTENLQFVQRYQSRILQARAEAQARRASSDTYSEADTASVGAQVPTDNPSELQQGAEVGTTDSASTGERAPQIDSVPHDGQATERPKPPTDTLRDTIPG
jgi:hypothetical protein